MYKKQSQGQSEFAEFEKFHLPFSGKLSGDNVWVTKAKIVPWVDLENEYALLFSQNMGAPGIIFRIALGSLLIQSTLGYTDEMTVQQIRENPYLQYFLGFCEYSYTLPFDPSMMTHFRKRISKDMLEKINDRITGIKKNDGDDNPGGNSGNKETKKESEEPANAGKLIVDATCIPSDIRYPTDISLLNEAREKTEKIIDIFNEQLKDKMKKPRTYRKKARKAFLQAIKSNNTKISERRKHIVKQLRYLRRDLNHIDKMILCEKCLLLRLSKKEYRDLLVIKELYRQQKEMYEEKKNHIEERIVSISQPQVRPIVRGKASAKTEFGAKVSISVVNGFSYADRIDWNNYNEGADLPDQVERYHKRFGHYPESVHADKKYQTRKNRDYCQERNIRFIGSKLGRPDNDKKKYKKHRLQMLSDLKYRIRVEGKIGVTKRKYGLGRIMAKLEETSKVMILLGFLSMNLDRRVCQVFSTILEWLGLAQKQTLFQ